MSLSCVLSKPYLHRVYSSIFKYFCIVLKISVIVRLEHFFDFLPYLANKEMANPPPAACLIFKVSPFFTVFFVIV